MNEKRPSLTKSLSLKSNVIEKVQRLFKTNFQFYELLQKANRHTNTYEINIPETVYFNAEESKANYFYTNEQGILEVI